jgi:ketosteroid isomerase-like protein
VPLRRGWEEVNGTFGWLAGRFLDVHAYDLELVAAGASGDLAYTVGLEHKTVVVPDAAEPVTYTLRVTHVYRREDGQWRIVHRHGDYPPVDAQAADATRTHAATSAP